MHLEAKHVEIGPNMAEVAEYLLIGKKKPMNGKFLPFGLICSPRVVTKLLKPVMALLWSTFGIYITVYMDDMLVQAKTKREAYLHSQITIPVLLCLGWEINRDKRNLIQSHEITHIGFTLILIQ